MAAKLSTCKAIRIKADSTEKILSKEQKKFNMLIKKIEKKKIFFKEWENAVRVFRHEISSENNKAYDEHDKHLTDLVCLLDAAYSNKIFTKTEKNKIKHMIISVVEDMMSDDGTEEAITIYNKYNTAASQFDEQLLDQQVGEMMKSMFEEMLGVKLDEDADVSSPEKFSEALNKKLKQRERLAEEKRSKRKKTAKQMEKEERLKQQEQDVSKSIQEIYRKMVAALHPDLEQDESEKVRKTKIMQEVNAAYAEKNLLRLFELQLELEHIDQDHLGNIAEEKLKLFNKILQSQLKELEQEVSFIERQAKMEIDWIPFFLSPDQFLGKLRQNVENIKKGIVQTKEYIERFASHQELKAFLKTYKIPRQQPQYF